MRLPLRVSACLLLFPIDLAIAQATPLAANACTYATCALSIAPVWNGLAVVRGAREEHVATLGFFLPGSLDGTFEGDSARYYGARAVRARGVGALLTDVGAALLATAAVRQLVSHAGRDNIAVFGAGAALLGVSIPVQFAADGLLSRAVWWHNARYAR